MSKALDQFEKDYRQVRLDLVRGNNPFVTVESMRDWLKMRSQMLIEDMAKERVAFLQKHLGAHPERELEFYHAGIRFHGIKEDDDD
jgi:hypothetical protein